MHIQPFAKPVTLGVTHIANATGCHTGPVRCADTSPATTKPTSEDPTVSTTRTATELALRAVAAPQRGLFTTTQASDTGWSRQRVHRWRVSGRIEPVHPQVYRFAGSPTDWMAQLLAALLAAGDEAVASHRSALALQDVEPARRDLPTPIEISIPAKRDAKLRGVVVHRVALPASDVTVIDGIPCTSYERTLLDNAAKLGPGQIGRGVDQGLVTNRATLPSIRHTAEPLRPAPGRRRARLLRIVDERAPESDSADSRPEIRLHAAIRDAGLPPPIAQFPVTVDGEDFFIDAAYPDLTLGIEYLGWDPHRTRTAFDADHRRDRLLTLAGWQILYFTSASTAEIVDHIRRLRTTSRSG
jgi:hypothetical protein